MMNSEPVDETLPDYLAKGLMIISIGLNPSIPSVEAGFYFANPRNRFWRALNASGLVPHQLEPGVEAMQQLYRQYSIGFTDVVKRPTPGAGQLRAADYRLWAPKLKQRLILLQPRIAWFHGKLAYSNYLKYADDMPSPKIAWGEQVHTIGDSRIFVTPNPSPANAAYSLDTLIQYYRELKCFRQSL